MYVCVRQGPGGGRPFVGAIQHLLVPLYMEVSHGRRGVEALKHTVPTLSIRLFMHEHVLSFAPINSTNGCVNLAARQLISADASTPEYKTESVGKRCRYDHNHPACFGRVNSGNQSQPHVLTLHHTTTCLHTYTAYWCAVP